MVKPHPPRKKDWPNGRDMTKVRKESMCLDSNPTAFITKKILDIYIIKPMRDTDFGALSYVSSPNCNFSTYKFSAPAIICLRPPPGWICVSLKSFSQNGISALSTSSEKTSSIRISTNEKPFWMVDISEAIYYNIVIKASLLAKHALGMIDTSVLKPGQTRSICSSTVKRLMEKLQYIESSSRYAAELDLRISHLILAICESIGDSPRPSALSSRDTLAHQAVETILKKQTLTTEELTEELFVEKQKLDMIFKSAIGLSVNQFLKAYQLNLIKDELAIGSRTLRECTKIYGFRSPKTLAKAYSELFGILPSQ